MGRGLTEVLSVETSQRIINEIIAPYFLRDNFHGAMDAGVDTVIKVIGGEPLPAPVRQPLSAQTSGNYGESSSYTGLAAFLSIGGVLMGGELLRRWLGALPGACVISVVTWCLVVWGGGPRYIRNVPYGAFWPAW